MAKIRSTWFMNAPCESMRYKKRLSRLWFPDEICSHFIYILFNEFGLSVNTELIAHLRKRTKNCVNPMLRISSPIVFLAYMCVTKKLINHPSPDHQITQNRIVSKFLTACSVRNFWVFLCRYVPIYLSIVCLFSIRYGNDRQFIHTCASFFTALPHR